MDCRRLVYRFNNSSLRELVWPIRSTELERFLWIAFLMFAILLNQNLIKSLKDSFIMILVGPEVISFIKLWCELPAGILFVLIYSKLCNVMTTEQVFRLVVAFFLFFFTFFAFILYPYQGYFHPDPDIVKYYTEQFPNFKWFVIIWGKWDIVLFYVMGELWPIIVFTLLFWQLANKVTKVDEAKRFYFFFNLFGQSNLLISGTIIYYFVRQEHFLQNLYGNLEDKTEIALKSLVTVVIFIGIIILYLHSKIEQKIIYSFENTNSKNNKTGILKLSLMQSAKMVLRSKYLGLICVLIVGYNTTINLIEGIWLSNVTVLYPTTQSFMCYQSDVLFWTGVCTICCTFIGGAIIRKYGWIVGAMATPLIILISGILFFTSVINEQNLYIILEGFSYLTPLMVIVFFGGLQNIFGKGTKYSLFDSTKEMLYIPLDDEMKTKGKAAVDIIGTKIGKSIGSVIQFIIFTTVPNATYNDIPILLATIFFIIIIFWVFGVIALSKSYTNLLLNIPL